MLTLFQTETSSQFISQNNYIFVNKLIICKALGDSYLLTTLGIGYALLISHSFNGDIKMAEDVFEYIYVVSL